MSIDEMTAAEAFQIYKCYFNSPTITLFSSSALLQIDDQKLAPNSHVLSFSDPGIFTGDLYFSRFSQRRH